jgi:hypothetical protein
LLSYYEINIPHLARILFDSLLLAPAYLFGIVILGIFNYWGFYVGSCTDKNMKPADCAFLWKSIARVQLLAMILGCICL